MLGHAFRHSRGGDSRDSRWWSPHRAAWWIGVLFAIGSICFLVGPFPGFVQLVGSAADGTVFFVGSLFFTSAALIQYLEAANADRGPEGGRMRLLRFEPRMTDWWATSIQLVGTVFFNISTFRALQDSYDSADVNRLIWTPDVLGSACFLISGVLGFLAVRHMRERDRREWRVAVVNLVGCVLFGISAIASYVVPSTGDALDLAAANWTTSLGALFFLIGAVMILARFAGAGTRGEVRRPS